MGRIDLDRLTGYEPGTIFREADGRRILVLWDRLAATSDNNRPCTYADPDTALEIEAVPVRLASVPVTASMDSNGRAANLALVDSLPAGSAFVESDERGRQHWFMKTFHGVMLDNGAHHVHAYDGGGDDASSVSVIFVPRGESPESRAAFERLTGTA